MPSEHDIRWKQRFGNYQKALRQLSDAVARSDIDKLHEQGIIQCFKYTFELAWKTLQDFLTEVRGYTEVRGPRPSLETAFQDAIIEDGQAWLKILQDRNLTSHLYDETEMQDILQRIREQHHPLFLALAIKLSDKS